MSYLFSFPQKNAIILLILMHIAGLLGLHWQITRPYFEALIAFNLLANMAILLYFHKDWQKKFFYFLIIAFFVGFFVEVLGVKTKIIFGDYWYVRNMGIKFLEVPLLIGVNWCLLVYCAGHLADFDKKMPVFLKAFFGASLMTFLDCWIEPFAIAFNMWDWQNGVVPLQNYIGWWLVSYVLMLVFYFLPFEKKNPLAKILFLCQFIFFMVHFLIT